MLKRKPIDPRRAPFFTDDIVKSRIDRLQNRILTDGIDIPEWEMRRAYYRGPADYRMIDKAWKKIRLGDTWGGADVTAFFRTKVTVPRRFQGRPVALVIHLGGMPC